MLETVKKSLADGNYDIAAFMAEQASQLYVKSVILEQIGETLQSHLQKSRPQLLSVAPQISEKT
jgi:HEPN domain-containing protein